MTPRFQAGDRVFVGVHSSSAIVLRAWTVLHVGTKRGYPAYAVLTQDGAVYADQLESELGATPREAWTSALAHEERQLAGCKIALEEILKRKADCLAQIRALDEAGTT